MSEPTRSRRFDRPTVGRAAIGGAVGGLAGAALFGGLLWAASPDVISESIPAFYGLAESIVTGWVLHLIHGAILGAIFGVIASRRLLFDVITGPVETHILEGLSASTRFALLGLVYGLALWVVLPFIGLSLLGTVTGASVPEAFPGVASDMILGHVLFGVIVGIGFSMVVPGRSRRLEN